MLRILEFHREEFVVKEPVKKGFKLTFVKVGASKGKGANVITIVTNYNEEKVDQLISELPSIYYEPDEDREEYKHDFPDE